MHTSPPRRFLLSVVFAAALFPAPSHAGPGAKITVGEPQPQLKEGDTIALLGGESVVQENETGYFESLLAVAHPDKQLHVRNLGWEGDTVFEQPRDVNFPGLVEQLRRVNATVIIAQFGRYESFAGQAGLDRFVAAYEKLCDDLARQTPRMVLVTPWKFEKPTDPALPDLTSRNADLQLYSDAIVALAQRRHFTSAGLSAADKPLTGNGSRLGIDGLKTMAMVQVLPFVPGATSIEAVSADVASFEKLRLAVVDKNRLWFQYARPTNWAFLGGDRVTVASSHDHANPAVRWFPGEIEKFKPLVESADARIHELAQAVAKKAAP
jgi:hypothetical protein